MDDVLALLVPQKKTPPPVAAGEGAQQITVPPQIVDSQSAAVKRLQDCAQAYLAAGLALVPIAAGSKGPNGKGWNKHDRCVTDPADVGRITEGVGLAHAYSRTACIDVDDIEQARAWLGQRGADLDALLSAPDAVGITSGRPGRAKLLYRLPDGVDPLATKNLGEIGLELRCATADGLTVQDVLPPSIHPETGKPYAWWFGDELVGSWAAPPALPPELLAIWLELIKPAAVEAPSRPPLGLSDAQICHVLRQKGPDQGYQDWLETGMALHHETAGQGRGLDLWDNWSRQSSKYAGRDDLATKWESFGRSSGPDRTMGSLMVQLPPDASEFEDLTLLDAGKPPRFQIQTMAEFRAARAAGLQWFVKGVLPRAGLVVLFGESGAGKTFAVLDLMFSISLGAPEWRGRRVKPGRVLYVVAEGVEGFKLRTEAYARQHEIDPDSLPLCVLADAPNLLARDDVASVIKQVELHGPFDLIAIDTLAQTTPGANENSGEDMGKALAHCREIRARTGATVLLVHHSGKDAAKGARGWSGLKAAADAEIEVLRDGDHREMRVSKLKDGDDGACFQFKLVPVLLGLDEDGDDITSCVVEHLDDGKKFQRRRAGPKGNVQRLVVRALGELLGLGLGEVKTTDLIDAAVNQMVAPEQGKQDKRRFHVMRAIEALTVGNVLRVEGGKVGEAE